MNKSVIIHMWNSLFLLSLLMLSCKKENVPTISTNSITNVTEISAISGGNITDDGGLTVLTRGICWSTESVATIENYHTSDGAGAGNFTSSLTGLVGGTRYYVRAYATNKNGIGYGMTMSFKTLGDPPSSPIVTTGAAVVTQMNNATLTGTVNAKYYSTNVVFEYGLTDSYGQTVSINQNPVLGSTNTQVSANISGLSIPNIYHYRIKATNILGTTVSNDRTFYTAYEIGGNINGGIIFYLDATSSHGLVCAPSNQSEAAIWGCNLTNIIGADGTVVGTGRQNTIDIVSSCNVLGIAARICNDLNLNNYSDWFLPSKDELNLMYTQLKLHGLGNFTNNTYWSSSEQTNDGAWGQGFSSGVQGNTGKEFAGAVRAIRAF